MMRQIQIVNQSTVVSDAAFVAAVAACQRQVREQFEPAWGGLTATLTGTKADPKAPHTPSVETIFVLDDADQAGVLGYHETVNDVPTGYVFARTSEDDNSPWQVTLSHELLEQLADAYTTTCAVVMFRGKPAAVEYEVCDPVENDTYEIDGVPVSNFVLPAWFQSPDKSVKGPFDYLGKLSQPLSLTSGGYVGYTTNLRRWQQLTAHMGERTKKYHRVIRRRGEGVVSGPQCGVTGTLTVKNGIVTGVTPERPVPAGAFVGGKKGRKAGV